MEISQRMPCLGKEFLHTPTSSQAATYFITKSQSPCIVPVRENDSHHRPVKHSSFLKGIFLLHVASRIRTDWPAGFLSLERIRKVIISR